MEQPAATTLGALALARARTGGDRPFVTFSDLETGERTELGNATFSNWVAKAANLLAEDLALGPGSRVALRVGGHWAGAIAAVAAWRAACVVDLAGTRPAAVAVAREDLDPPPADELLVVGRALGARVQAPVERGEPFADEVLAQADEFTGPTIEPEAPALDAGGGIPASQRQVLADALQLIERTGLGPGGRLLSTQPVDSLEGLVALAAALVADAGIVLVPGADAEAAARIAATERCTHSVPISGLRNSAEPGQSPAPGSGR